MGKCYVSGKIGKPEEGQSVEEWEAAYMEKFRKASDYVRDVLGMEPVNPTLLPHNHGRTWREYMNEDIQAMLPCSDIYMIEDWILSRGAKVEHTIAKGLGMPIHHAPGWERLPDVDRFVKAGTGCDYRVSLPDTSWMEEGAHYSRNRYAEYRIDFIGKRPYWKLHSMGEC